MARVATKYPYPLVEVLWIDAETDGDGWLSPDEKTPVAPEVITVGFLVYDKDDIIQIASTIAVDKSHNSRIIIPKGMVKSMKVLKK